MSRARSWLFALFMCLCCCIFISLCHWQVQRLHWKQTLLAAREAELARTDLSQFTTDDMAAIVSGQAYLRRGQLTGTLDLCKAVYLDNRAQGGITGQYVLAPLQTSQGMVVYTNLGWFTREQALPSRCASHEVTITGLLVLPRNNRFVPLREMAPRHWVAQAPQYMGALDGLKNVQEPVLVAQDISPALPEPRPTLVPAEELTPPNNHLQYALFWGVMALMTAGMTLYALYINRRRQAQ